MIRHLVLVMICGRSDLVVFVDTIRIKQKTKFLNDIKIKYITKLLNEMKPLMCCRNFLFSKRKADQK